ncbi:type II secretion system secretin GspD [bacterium]|nr:type II secretion system secretin GspD [bacterium]
MKKQNIIISVVVVLTIMLMATEVFAQGFKKLDVSDKYGTQDVTPINSSSPDGSNVQTTIPGQEKIRFNGVDVDLKDMVDQINKLTGKNFIINDKVRGKITIISEKEMTKDEVYQAFLSALEINGYTTVMTPSGLINIVPQKDSLSKPIEVYKDQSPNTDNYITRIIQLKNISANDVSTVIKGLISKSGNMFAYPATNSIIVTDTGSNINHILKLIKELDQEGPQETMALIPIVNADAKDIADKISQLFEQDSSKTATRSVRTRRTRTASPELEDVQTVSKVLSDERTNSVIIFGTKRGILKVRQFIAKLDRSIGGAEGRIHVYYLKYAKAEDVSNVLSNLVSGSSTSSSSSKKTSKAKPASTSSGSVTLEGGVQVTADEDTNSLVVVASPKDYQTLVKQVIEKLDIVRPQVYLEAVIMSLDVQKSSSLGISGLGGLLTSLSGNAFTAFGSVMPATPTSITTLAGASGGFGGGVFSSDTIDFTLSDGSTASVPAVSGIIMALASDTDANVLSTPSIMTLDNQEAKIQVGQEVPVLNGTTVSSGVTSFDVTREDTGIILTITPQISESDTVRLQIAQEITSVFSTDANLGPTLDKKAVDTVVVAKNKQTIVIGGLIDDKQTVTTHKVPLLGDIPVLGNLFRNRVNTKQKTNLIVFITPYIIREKQDYLAILKKKIEERNNFIDMNYGKSQKKHIRSAINNHAEDLLEFRCFQRDDTDPCYAAVDTTNTTQSYQEPTVQQDIQSSTTQTTTETTDGYYGPKKKVRYRK